MSSEKEYLQNTIESVSKGAVKGALEWTEKKVTEMVKKFILNRNIAFIEDIETIDIAREQRTKSEWNLFKSHIKNKEFRILFQIGLTLRELEREGKPLQPLKRKIIDKYDTEGLHIAHVVQNGIFSRYIGTVLDTVTTPQKLKFEIEKLFENIDNTVSFIEEGDNVMKKTNQIVTKINANSPKTFIISSVGRAMEKCEKIKNNVINEILNYTCELYQAENKKIYFLNKIEIEF